MPDDTQQAVPPVPSPAAGDEPPEHHMHLLGRHYRQVEAGRKTIEVRVATANRRAISVGETVVFHDRDTGRELDVIMQRVTPYPSFDDLLRSEDTARINPDGSPDQLLADLRGIYPPAKEALGVLALTFDHRPARPGRALPMTAEEYAQTVPHHTVYGCLYIRDEHDRPVQLRSVYGSRLWQFPGGNLDAPGEDPLQTARRETVEETGLEPALNTPTLLLTHFLHAGPRQPLNKVGLVFDGGQLTADQLDRIRLDPAEHDMWAVHDLATWQELMAPRAFARLDAIDRTSPTRRGPRLLDHTHLTPRTPAHQEATVPAEDTNTRAWQIYGQRQLARAYAPPVPERLGWTPWDGIGPGAEVLGDVTGRRVLDIGSGAGHHAVHLAQVHGARVTGIELSPTQHERAVSTHVDVDGVEFVRADVAEYLDGAKPFDAAYAIGTLAFIDPHRSLPALRDGLRPDAPLILSLLHTDLHGHGPSTAVAPREQMILLRDDPPLPTQMWVLAPQLWEDLLTEYGFRVEAIDLFPHPGENAKVIQQLIRARRLPDRPTRVSSRPRSTRGPAAHAAVGVGAILLSEQGILLGRHRRGTLELPGGSVEATGESFEEAVVRELAEETGLVARTGDVELLGTFVDHVEGVVRVTVGALVHAWQGQPLTQPDESVGDWAWYPLDQLPNGLFVCSAQILTSWRPDLPIDHPPAHFTAFAPAK